MISAQVPVADEETAKRSIWEGVSALWHEGCVVELRSLNTKQRTQSGYFDDPKLLAKAAYQLDRQGVPAVYVTLNPVDPALFARAPNQVLTFARDTTQDNHVVRRRRLLIDLDPKRPTGIGATNVEHDAALERARAVCAFLCERQWPAPLIVDSGNGAHLVFTVDLANDADATKLLAAVLRTLAHRFDDTAVEVDQTVHNAARIVKLPGTMARKGFDIAERPHRRSHILELPTDFGKNVVTRELLQALVPREEPSRFGSAAGEFDLEGFLARHMTVKSGPNPHAHGERWIVQCPFNGDHSGTSAAILRLPPGGIIFKCQHNGCRNRNWADIRAQFEPGYRREMSPAAPAGAPPPRNVERVGNALAPRTVEPPDLGVVSFDELAGTMGETVDWVIEGFLRRGGIMLLTSKPKVGKSDTARNIAKSIAMGRPFLGRRCQQGSVLWIGLEEPATHLRDRLEVMEMTSLMNVHYVTKRPAIDKALWLQLVVEKYRPDFVIVDTIGRFSDIENFNDYTQVTRATQPMLDLRERLGTSFCLLHHNNHADTTLGSTAWEALVDSIVSLTRSPDNARFARSKQRSGIDLEPTVLSMDQDTGELSIAESALTADQRIAERNILRYLERTGEATREDLARHAGRPARIGRAAVDALVASGLAVVTGRGTKTEPRLYRLSKSAAPSAQFQVSTSASIHVEESEESEEKLASEFASLRGISEEPPRHLRAIPSYSEDSDESEESGVGYRERIGPARVADATADLEREVDAVLGPAEWGRV